MGINLDQLYSLVGPGLLILLGYFLQRERQKIDDNIKELTAEQRDITKQLHGIDIRLVAAETTIRSWDDE